MKKTMRKMTALVAMAAFTGLVFNSCSGGGSATDASGNGILGDVTKVAAEYGAQGVELFESLLAAENAEQVKDFPAKIKQIDSLSNAAIDEALAELKDKELPTEVAANVPLKVVTPFKLDAEKSDHDKLQLVAEVESTQDTWSSDNKDGFRFSHLRVLFADDSKGLCTVKKEKYSTDVDRKDAHLAGTKGLVTVNLQLTPWNATLLDKAQKIVITTVEDDTYKAVRDSTRSAEKAFDKKILEVVTKIAKFAREEK